MKILLLEDEVMLQSAIVEYLQMHNHRVDAFVAHRVHDSAFAAFGSASEAESGSRGKVR